VVEPDCEDFDRIQTVKRTSGIESERKIRSILKSCKSQVIEGQERKAGVEKGVEIRIAWRFSRRKSVSERRTL